MHRGKDKAAMEGDTARAGSCHGRMPTRIPPPVADGGTASLAVLPEIAPFNLILRYRHRSINQAVVNWYSCYSFRL